jgi:hypothetical protein
MDWAGKQHPVEALVEWLAPAALAGAVGWSAVTVGFSPAIVALAMPAVLVIGFLAIRRTGLSAETAAAAFEPVSFELAGVEPDELLLDNVLREVADGDELLLDDPLIDMSDDARVVRLFARQEPTPGELVARIEGFLSDGARGGPRPSPIPDASAALQAALANVRASLR